MHLSRWVLTMDLTRNRCGLCDDDCDDDDCSGGDCVRNRCGHRRHHCHCCHCHSPLNHSLQTLSSCGKCSTLSQLCDVLLSSSSLLCNEQTQHSSILLDVFMSLCSLSSTPSAHRIFFFGFLRNRNRTAISCCC